MTKHLQLFYLQLTPLFTYLITVSACIIQKVFCRANKESVQNEIHSTFPTFLVPYDVGFRNLDSARTELAISINFTSDDVTQARWNWNFRRDRVSSRGTIFNLMTFQDAFDEVATFAVS